ncbi:MAG: TlpA disulfide reductase family protein, partial [Flavobacteriales bacterium]
WKEPWSAVRNEGAALSNPYSLTTITNASQKLDFQFPDTDGNLVSLSDPIFKNKALIVEIMASWCSNCKDETEYLADLYDKYKHSGLEIVALAYERHSNFKKAAQCVLKHKNSLGAKYRFLIAGPADKQKASRDFPMLNGIISFPTTIFLDKKGVLRRIYTGFYGPGTGAYYSKFKQETDSLVQKLVSE